MAHRTRFAGLAAPDPGEGEMVLNGDLIYRNPDLIDQFLHIGAVTHHHDGHLSLPDPHTSVTLVAVASGGTLQGNTTYYVTYTVNDKFGGETRGAPAASVFMSGQIATPTIAPSAGVDHAGGIMPAGNYAYALTYTDGQGGETPLGPTTWVQIPPGYASSQVDLTGLASQLIGSGGAAVAWRLWRSYEGADWHLVTQNTTNTFVDAGFDPPDNPARPPLNNTTLGTGSIRVTLPAASADQAIASASLLTIYMSTDPALSSPSLLMTLPIACAGATFTITSDGVAYGQPPVVSLSLSGAAQINPDTDILNWTWKRPVSTSTALPSGAQGDVRMTLDTGHLWGVLNSSGAVGSADWTDLFTIVPDSDSQFLTNFLASASGGASSSVRSVLEFVGSGIASVVVQDLGGGSGVVSLTVPPPPPPTSPQLQGVGGSGAVPLIDPAYYVQFAGINGVAVTVTGQGGGSAQVLVDASVATGSSSTSVSGSGGVGLITPVRNFQFGASGGVNLAVQNLGGGSASVLIGSPGGIPKATQASGYAFGVNDPGTVVESASAGNGSSMTAFYVNPHSQTPVPVDSVIEVFQYGTGQVMIVPSGGVLLRSDGGKTKTAAQFATVGLRQRAVDEWVLSGDLST